MSINNGTFPTDVRAAAEYYLALGLVPIPVPRTGGGKKPIFKGWQKLTIDTVDLNTLFQQGSALNIGLLLGQPSGGLVDVDLDAPEAVAAGQLVLPATGWISGRVSKPRSHWWYRVSNPPRKATEKYSDIDGTVLVELRSTGGQTIVPPSIHATGQKVVWDCCSGPTSIHLRELESSVGRTAALALLARHWPKPGARQEAYMALVRGLLHSDWDAGATTEVLRVLVQLTNDNELAKRLGLVESTAEKIEAQMPTTGWPTLVEMLGSDGSEVLSRFRKWLQIPTRADHTKDQVGGAAPPGSNPSKSVRLKVIDLATIRPRPVTWQVPYILPRGKLVVIAGDGGNGKTLITLDLAACLTTGRCAFGLDYVPPDPMEILLISAEDDLADTVVPRLLAAGADLSKIGRAEATLTTDGKAIQLSLADLDAIREELRQRPNVGVVFIDPVGAYLARTGADDHRDTDLRAVLDPLSELAAETGVTFVLVKHLNKSTSANRAVHRISGSMAISNAVRVVHLVAPRPDCDDPAAKVFVRAKANIVPPDAPTALAYRIESLEDIEIDRILDELEVSPDDRGNRDNWQLCRVRWDGAVDLTAEAVFASNTDKTPKRKKAEEAEIWLRTFLAEFAYPSDEVFAAADQEGFKRGQVYDAKKLSEKPDSELPKIVASKRGQDGQWWWGIGPATGWKWRSSPTTVPNFDRFGPNFHPVVERCPKFQSSEVPDFQAESCN